MSKITLGADEIGELVANYPAEVVHARYALRLLERHAQEVSAACDENAVFFNLIDGLGQLFQCVDEGYGYIDRYLSNKESDPDDESTAVLEEDGPMSLRELNECLLEVAESLDSCLDDWPEVALESPGVSARRQEEIEQEVESVWERVREVGYTVHGILIGADFGPAELLFREGGDFHAPFASEVPVVAQVALDRALALALSDWADPNKRCVAITIALALTVCPDRIEVRQGERGEDVAVRFDCIKVKFPEAIGEGNFLWSNAVKCRDGSGAVRYEWLPDLAETYSDHTKNVACLRDLRQYLPAAKDRIATAAVLGLAWARLQRIEVSNSYHITGSNESSGHFISCSQLALGIQVGEEGVRSAWYPGL